MKVSRLQLAVPSLKSLFVETRFEETVLGVATAFLASNNRESHCALITNRHVVTGRHQEDGGGLSKMGGIPDNIKIYFHKKTGESGESAWIPICLPLYRADGTPYWFEHSQLGSKADVVALNLHWGSDVEKFPYYLETDLDQFGIEIGPAEPVSVIGFPFGRSTVERYPIWATGFLAQEISLVTPGNPTFLIDCRTREGQSGSPVLAYRAGMYRKRVGDKTRTTMTGGVVWELLGVYSGRIRDDSDMGTVWHTSAIADVLAVATADQQVREARQAATKPTNQPSQDGPTHG